MNDEATNPYASPQTMGAVSADVMSDLSVNVVLTNDVFAEALRLHSANQLRIARLMMYLGGLPLMGLAAMIWLWETQGMIFFGLCLFISWGLAAYLPWLTRKRIRQICLSADDGQRKLTMEFTPEYLRVITSSTDNRTEWNGFRSSREGKHVILLYRSRWFFNVIPIDQVPREAIELIRSRI